MPIEHAIWTVGDSPSPLPVCKLESEQLLEEMIVSQPSILSDEWLLIGQQEVTPAGGRLDLIAVAPDASLILIELKRDKTPRDIVAQALDYASWVETLSADKISQIYHRFSKGGSLDEAFREKFGADLDEEQLNESHQIILCASELDRATERIVGYLNDKDIPINVLFFRVFKMQDTQLLSRTWLIDPGETQENAVNTARTKGPTEPWIGEFYGSFGDGESRSWEEARKYGFFCAGGGTWYTKTLGMLEPGNRIWVRIPGEGFVGVGTVTGTVQPASEFQLDTGDGERPCLDVLTEGSYHREYADDPTKSEYFISVRWEEARSVAKAFHETGLFGQQNSVCKPRSTKWRHTVDRLKEVFTHWNDEVS